MTTPPVQLPDDGHGAGRLRPTCLTTLREPRPAGPMPGCAPQILALQDELSPGWALDWLIDNVTGHNPFEELAACFSGDVEALSRAGDAVRNLGRYLAAYGADLRTAQNATAPHWTGEDADVMNSYLCGLADDLAALEAPLQQVAEQVQAVATSVHVAGQAVQGALRELVDCAIAAALVAAAGALAAEPGAGPAAAADAYLAAQARQSWLEATAWHGRATAAAQALPELAGACLTQLDEVSTRPLPGGGAGAEAPR